jgi:hypothetical protein
MEHKLKDVFNKVSSEYDFDETIIFQTNNKKRFEPKKWSVSLASLFFISTMVYLFVPEVNSMTNQWIDQIFEVSTEDKPEIKDGYVFIDGIKTVSEESYELGMYRPIYNGSGYDLERYENSTLMMGKDELVPILNYNEATKKLDMSFVFPKSEHSYLTLERIYADNDNKIVSSYKGSNNEQIILSINEHDSYSRVMLDDMKELGFVEEGFIGKRPSKYWNYEDNSPSVRTDYGANIVYQGVEYSFSGFNLSEDELVEFIKYYFYK